MEIWAVLKDRSSEVRSTVRGAVGGRGDPGYALTAKMLAEAAVCLAKGVIEEERKDTEDIALPAEYGVLTPSTALGAALRERLHAKDILHFSVAGPLT